MKLSIAVALVGCVGTIDTGDSSEQGLAQEKWVAKALPIFKANCSSCHSGSQPPIAFLQGADDLDIRTTLLKFDPQVVNVDAPQSSRVLTKGPHSGPDMLADQKSDVLEWITAEHDAADKTGAGTTIVKTTPFTPELCTAGVAGSSTCPVNHVDLGPVGLAGARIDFVAQPLSQDLYVTDLVLKAATDGAYIEHPLLVWVPPTGPILPDSLDRFFAVKLDLKASTSGSIGGGTGAFIGFTPPSTSDPSQLYITFKVVDKYRAGGDTSGGMTGGTTGCKVLTQFKTDVVPVMAMNLAGEATNCAGCHTGANGAATSAMDLTGINSGQDALIETACNQVRTRINFQTIAQSGVLLAPQAGQDGAHPFKLQAASFTTFSGKLSGWANAEKTAP